MFWLLLAPSATIREVGTGTGRRNGDGEWPAGGYLAV